MSKKRPPAPNTNPVQKRKKQQEEPEKKPSRLEIAENLIRDHIKECETEFVELPIDNKKYMVEYLKFAKKWIANRYIYTRKHAQELWESLCNKFDVGGDRADCILEFNEITK